MTSPHLLLSLLSQAPIIFSLETAYLFSAIKRKGWMLFSEEYLTSYKNYNQQSSKASVFALFEEIRKSNNKLLID